jgi:hypothetical protein
MVIEGASFYHLGASAIQQNSKIPFLAHAGVWRWVPNETKYYDVGMFVTPIKEGTISVCGEGESSSGDDVGNAKKRRLG